MRELFEYRYYRYSTITLMIFFFLYRNYSINHSTEHFFLIEIRCDYVYLFKKLTRGSCWLHALVILLKTTSRETKKQTHQGLSRTPNNLTWRNFGRLKIYCILFYSVLLSMLTVYIVILHKHPRRTAGICGFISIWDIRIY